MKNSNILFIVAVLILVWFGSETITGQQICVTSCVDLSGMSSWEQAVSVLILPVIILLGAIRVRKNEKVTEGSRPSQNV
jgi:membrane protein implicated in regulation of membrane protease activity